MLSGQSSGSLQVTRASGPAVLCDEFVTGRRALDARFRSAPPRTFPPGELLAAAACSTNVIYHLVEGWACQFRDFSDGHQAIVDVYTPSG